MDEVNQAFEYMDEEGMKELYEDILVGTEELLDSYITQRIDEDSIAYEMPSAATSHQKLQELRDLLQILLDTHQSYTDNELYILFQLACMVRGELMPIPTDKIVSGTGTIEEVCRKDVEEDPPRDDREGIRFRYYFVQEIDKTIDLGEVKIIPCALYKYEDGEWRAIGYTKDTLKHYWHKTDERVEIEDRILDLCYVVPTNRVVDIVHESWNRIHASD